MKKDYKKLLAELGSENDRIERFLKFMNEKITDIDKRYGQAIVKDDINALRDYKKILEREVANN